LKLKEEVQIMQPNLPSSKASLTLQNISIPRSRLIPPRLPSPYTRVILVRHGRSTYNEQGRYQGSSDDATLTEKGKVTAQQTAEVLKDIAIDAIYASPLIRVKQTLYEMMIIVGETTSIRSVKFLDQLREIDMPNWEGLSFQQVREQFSEDYTCWKQRPHELHMDNSLLSLRCYPVVDLYQRAQEFWQTVLPHHVGQTLLVVSHGGTNHALISTALGIGAEHHHTLQQSNCGISILEFSAGAQQAQLQAVNLTEHLGETLPKLKEGKKGLRLLLVPYSGNSADYETIATTLQPVPIDFSLSIASEASQQAIAQILTHHPTAIQLQTEREDFAQAWQRSMAHQRRFHPQVMTGLVVASIPVLQSLIAQSIEHRRVHIMVPNSLTESIHLHPGTLSVLHYPSAEHPPILQALNFGQGLAALVSPMS
jgi:phosphoserine phosphatase